ncbi:Gfo/Idh/MocA family protein [Paenibacillus yanchengensis]|uniref:Gfo/Idh/MocA family protein n=1 Tax=Paenibacillus yanchengensis TaxID=2035833 RepID=A0ABW4YFW8_9BACL
MSEQLLKIGMIGLDTSHVVAFTELLNSADHEHHVSGGKVIVAYPGGSADFELSYGRVEQFTTALKEKHNITIVDTIEEVATMSDALLLESVDGRVHLEQFQQIASYGKPVFIDKPLTTSYADAEAIYQLAKQHNAPVMSCSSLRYAGTFQEALADEQKGAIYGADCYGPLALQPTQPGLFWYGVHTAEMLFAALGAGCEEVRAVVEEDHEVYVGKWSGGRLGTLRGNRSGNGQFGAVVHRQAGSQLIDVQASKIPFYALMLQQIISFFKSGQSAIPAEETLAIIRFIEAANKSRQTGLSVKL